MAVIGFDPVRRSWVSEAAAHGGAPRPLARLPRLDGVLVTDAAARDAAGEDFGHQIHREPVAVLRPGSKRDIVEMVRYARQHGLKIAMRGQAHSTFGQSLVAGGIVIDSATWNTVQEVGNGWARVDAGATWRAVLDKTLPLGQTPPTLPNFLDLTVGGNLSVGGVGGAAHRHGAIVDNVLELEVVTGKGDLRRCSPTDNAGLFNAVLGGLGQFGIIVSARIKLQPAFPMARMYMLSYPDAATFLADTKTLALDERFHHIEGEAPPNASGGYGTFKLMAVSYFHPSAPPNDAGMIGDLLHDPATVQITDMPYAAFLTRIDPIIQLQKMLGVWTFPHPWFDAFVPHSRTEQFATNILSTLTLADTGNGPVLLYPMRRSKLTRPFFRVPDEEVFYLFDILSTAPPDPAVVEAQINRNRVLFDAAKTAGGKRYCIGSLRFDRADWRAHFRPHWPAFLLSKAVFDPSNVLTPGQGIFTGDSCGDD